MSTVPAHIKCDYDDCTNRMEPNHPVGEWCHIYVDGNTEALADFCCMEHLALHYGGKEVRTRRSPVFKLTDSGRKSALDDKDIEQVQELYTGSTHTPVADIADRFGVSRSTIYKALNLKD